MPGNKNIERRPKTVNVPVPGSLNADATESSMPKGDFLELRNYRKPTADTVQVRSGYKKKTFTGAYTPVGACEYRLDDQYANVLFYNDGGELTARVYDGDRDPELDVIIPAIVAAVPAGSAEYEVQASQFNTFLILTVYNVGVFALYPTAADLSTWNFRELGKELSPTPDSLSYAAKLTGDLIVYQPIPFSDPDSNNGTNCKGQYAAVVGTSTEPMKTRIPMGAPYFLVAGSDTNGVNLQSTNIVRQFEPETASAQSSDNSPKLQSGTTQRAVGTKYHIQKRGWFYKFLVKSQYIDIRGQKITYYHEASVDIFVPDNNYAPPFPVRSTGGVAPFYGLTHTIFQTPVPDEIDSWRGVLLPGGEAGNTDLRTMPDIGATNPFPSVAPHDVYYNFIQGYRNFFHDTTPLNKTDNNSGTQMPYYFTAALLGYELKAFDPVNIPSEVFWYIYPYKISVPASELSGAPQTIFDWSLFSGLPSDAVEIEIYRTAHTDSAQFAPNIYGLAGSLALPGTGTSSFTDSTADWNLDFNGRADSQTGYLQGEFSGKVIRVYNNNLRLGDTVTTLNIRKPSPLVQAFAFDAGSVTAQITRADLLSFAYDDLPTVAFAYQYVDNNSYVSELTPFAIITDADGNPCQVDTLGTSDSTVGVAVTLPHGYNDTITNIYVFEGRVIAGVRVWRRTRDAEGKTSVDPKDGHLIYPGNLLGWGFELEAAPADHIVSKDRGACIWSEESDMFFWPPENFELEHEFAPVTHIGNVVGPALVLTDMSQIQTTFGVDNRWEEVHDATGSVGRQCALKIGRPVFYLSSGGLNITEGYGIRPFPAATQELIRSYLLEEIPNQPSLANARRASLGWLERRKELWLRIPSSVDLGGSMPAVTVVYQFFLDYGTYSPKDAQNYIFDIIPGDPGTPVYFISSKRGRLFAFMNDPDLNRMLFIDCDVETLPWDSDAYFTLPLASGTTDVIKELEGVSMTYDRSCAMDIATGMRRTDGIEDDLVHGPLDPACEIIPVGPPSGTFRQPFYHPVGGKFIENIADWMPCIRIHTEPNLGGAHMFRLQAISVKLAEKEDAFVTHS